MKARKERIAEILRGPEGEGIYLSLLRYAKRLARRYGWRTGQDLPQGQTPQAVVGDVIVKILQGQREWDDDECPSLLVALKGMVRSDVGHLFEAYETLHVESISALLPDGTERSADDFQASSPNPEEQFLQSESTQLELVALDLILKEVEGKPDLESVFLALYEAGSRQDIMRLTQHTEERVDALRKELNRIAARITPARVARVARERRKEVK